MASLPVSSALIGRGGELSALLDAVGGDTRTVLIAGEAGLGKSRLIGEFTRRLPRDTLVVSGRCPEFGSEGVAFAPFLAVARALLRELGVAELAAMLSPQPALATWLPQLSVYTGTPAVESDRTRLFGEILTVVEQLAMTRQLVLVLEDLHWADPATRELLTFLTANLADGDVLLIGSYRPGEVGPLRGVIAELRRNPGVLALELAPLTRYEVGRQLAALLAREPEPALITQVFERSGGNPLFVEALGQHPDHIPADLTDLLLGFQHGLTPPAHTTLRLAAVIGTPIRHDLLAETADLDDTALHAALRELITRQLLLTTDPGYEFRHILIRQAIYDDLLPVERTRLHARLAAVLHTSPTQSGHPAELAHHAAAAGALPIALAAYWSAAGGTAATVAAEGVPADPFGASAGPSAASAGVSAPERVAYLEQLLALWDQVPDPAALLGVPKVTVLEQLTESAVAAGATERGIAAADAALALIDATENPAPAARLHLRRALLRGSTGAGPGDDLTRALALLPATPTTLEHAEALAQFALTNVFAGNAAAAAPAANTALSLAQSLSAPALSARAHAYLGLIAASGTPGMRSGSATSPSGTFTTPLESDATPDRRVTGPRPGVRANDAGAQSDSARPAAIDRARVADSTVDAIVRRHFEAARAAARQARDPLVLLDVVTWESAVLLAAGEYEAAISAVQVGLRAAQESFRFARSAPILLVKWVQALTALGRWDEARTVVDDTEFDRLPPLSRAALLLSYGKIALGQGDATSAQMYADQAGALLGDGRWAIPYRLQRHLLHGSIAFQSGDAEGVGRVLTDVWSLDDVTATLAAHPHDAWPLLALAARFAQAGSDSSDRRDARVMEALEGLVAVGDSLVCTSAVDAALHAVCTAWRRARVGEWGTAAGAWRELGQPFEEAGCLLAMAELLAGQGERGAAAGALRRVVELASGLSAEPLIAGAGRVASRAGISLDGRAGVPSEVRQGAPRTFGLTSRELEVLRLVAKGLSNRAVAGELFISANTAGVHVSRILAKLGVASRTEAAAFAHEHGLVG